MAKNWVRDLAFSTGVVQDRGYLPHMWLVAYHMLRCAGYSWIWECDGLRGLLNGEVPNHIPDGNMEGDVSNWSAVGSPVTRSKSTSTVYSGTQSLEITAAVGGEVQSTISTSTPQTKGTTGGFSETGGIVTFTAAGSFPHFAPRDVGKTITFTGAEDGFNNGSFTIASVLDYNKVTYSNGSGVTIFTNPSLIWYIPTTIHLAIWVNNPGSQTWNVDVDPGNGTPVNVGSFAGTTGWEIKHFDFTGASNGNIQVFIRPQGTSETIHIDAMLAFRSFFEFTGDYEDYADGDTGAYVAQSASDEFESSNYTFVTGDVGKILFIFDQSGTYPKNTGAYAITGINSGRAVVDLRSPTAALTAQDGSSDALTWRMVDVYKWASQVGYYGGTGYNCVEVYNGFGLESPHSSKWRFVLRGLWTDHDGSGRNGCVHWSAPEDTDLDVDSGNFFIGAGPSLTAYGAGRNKTIQELNISTPVTIYGAGGATSNINWMMSEATDTTYTLRFSMMFEDSGAWFFMASDPTSAGDQRTAGLFGIVGQDAYHPGIEAHCHLSSRDEGMSGGTSRNFLDYNFASYRWDAHGKGIGPDGKPVRIGSGQFQAAGTGVYVWEQSNAQPNPFSGDEWIQPLLLIRGEPDAGSWSEREADGIYQGRANMLLWTTFGNITGVGDSIAFAANICTLTDAAALFTADMDGHEITIIGSGSGNDGTFVLTYISATQVSWTNAGGATEGGFTGTWNVDMATHLHLDYGLCIDWMGERIN